MAHRSSSARRDMGTSKALLEGSTMEPDLGPGNLTSPDRTLRLGVGRNLLWESARRMVISRLELEDRQKALGCKVLVRDGVAMDTAAEELKQRKELMDRDHRERSCWGKIKHEKKYTAIDEAIHMQR